MNPYLIAGVVLAWSVSTGAAFFYGQGVGKDREVARQAEILQAIADTRHQAELGAAHAIAQIKITNTTIRGQTETIVRENVRYVECEHPDGQLRNLNAALTNRPEPPGGGSLPGADPAPRSELRRNDAQAR